MCQYRINGKSNYEIPKALNYFLKDGGVDKDKFVVN